jgi:HSP20 family protein
MSLSTWDPFLSTGGYLGTYEPFDEMRRMFRQMDRMITSPIWTSTLNSRNQELAPWRPIIDVRETDRNVVVHCELPGVQRSDINLQLNQGILTISGERKFEKKYEGENFRRMERSYGAFSRSLQVPDNVTEKDIKATFENGVLEVTFPKAEEQMVQPKRITIS